MTSYRLLDGETVSLRGLKPWELKFLRDLKKLAGDGTSYYQVENFALGAGSPANHSVDGPYFAKPLFLVARDIAARVGQKQGIVTSDDEHAPRGALSVAQAAHLIGVSKTAVYKAIEKGALHAVRIGSLTVVNRSAAEAYRGRRLAS